MNYVNLCKGILAKYVGQYSIFCSRIHNMKKMFFISRYDCPKPLTIMFCNTIFTLNLIISQFFEILCFVFRKVCVVLYLTVISSSEIFGKSMKLERNKFCFKIFISKSRNIIHFYLKFFFLRINISIKLLWKPLLYPISLISVCTSSNLSVVRGKEKTRCKRNFKLSVSRWSQWWELFRMYLWVLVSFLKSSNSILFWTLLIANTFRKGNSPLLSRSNVNFTD